MSAKKATAAKDANVEEIIGYLKESIISGEFGPGEKINEAQVCRVLGAGRGRVREALRILAYEDLIDNIPFKGAVVKEISLKDMAQVYDIISVLEGLAVRVVTSLITAEHLSKIEQMAEEMESVRGDFKEVYRLNLEFHAFLARLSGNERLIGLLENLYAQLNVQRMGLRGFENLDQVEATISEHRQILEAIKSRDALRAEELVRDHHMVSKYRLIRFLNRTI